MKSVRRFTIQKALFFSSNFFSTSGSYPLKDILKDVRSGTLSIDAAIKIVSQNKPPASAVAETTVSAPDHSISVGNFATLDLSRAARAGFPEVIFGGGKTGEQVAAIFTALHVSKAASSLPVIATKISPDKAQEITSILGGKINIKYDPNNQILSSIPSKKMEPSVQGHVVAMCAGTSDVPICEEAAVLLELSGVTTVSRIYDVGVAGLHRLLSRLPHFQDADVIIVCAGMDGGVYTLIMNISFYDNIFFPFYSVHLSNTLALPSVVAGLVRAPVIAVPTSVGYGAAFGGVAPLLTMLNSCAPGVTVVNIDNGFGAAVAAYKMLLVGHKSGTSEELGGYKTTTTTESTVTTKLV
jgi:pyridinium-3,5-biscarboxylic acid mononucleotide synthase